MEMDEILALQRELASVQASSSSTKLSEHNCIDILLKLIENGTLPNIIFSTSGKDYLTPKRLKQEIEQEIQLSGGRINLIELAPILNVDILHVENCVNNQILQTNATSTTKDSNSNSKSGIKSNGKYYILDGQLILSKIYLNSICSEIFELLNSRLNSLTITELANKYLLPATFIKDIIEERIETHNASQTKQNAVYIRGNELFTQQTIERHKCRIKGLLLGQTQPISIKSLLQSHSDYLFEHLVVSDIQNLIASHAVNGVLRGNDDRAIYTPNIYLKAQEIEVNNFYNANQYIDYEKLSNLQISNPKQYLLNLFPQGIALQTAFVSEVTLETLINSLEEECINSNSFVNLSSLLPQAINRVDQRTLVSKALEKITKSTNENKGKITEMGDNYCIATNLLNEIKTGLDKQLEVLALQKIQQKQQEIMQNKLKPKESSATPNSSKAKKTVTIVENKHSDSDNDSDSNSANDGTDSDEESKSKSIPTPVLKKQNSTESNSSKSSKSSVSKEELAKQKREERKLKRKQKKADQHVATMGGGKTSSGKTKGKKGNESDDDSEPESEEEVVETTNKKKAGANKSAAAPSKSTKPVVHNELAQLKSISLTRDMLSELIISISNSVLSANPSSNSDFSKLPADLVKPIVAHLLSGAVKKFEQIVEKLATTAQSETNNNSAGSSGPTIDRRVLLEQFQSALQSAYDHIIVFSTAVQNLTSLNNTNNAAIALTITKLQSQLEAHLLKTLCNAVIDSVIRYECYNNGIQLSDVDEKSSSINNNNSESKSDPVTQLINQFQSPLTPSQRDSSLKQLPTKVQLGLKPLIDSISSTNSNTTNPCTTFLTSFEPSLQNASELRFKKIDKKQARTVTFSMRKEFLNDLTTDTNPLAIFQYAILLLHNRVTGDILHSPAKFMPQILKLMKTNLQPLVYAKLRRFKELCLRLVKANSNNDSTALDSDDELSDNIILKNGGTEIMTANAVSTMQLNEVQSTSESEKEYVKQMGLDTVKAVVTSSNK